MNNIKMQINGNLVIYFDDKSYKSTIQDIQESYMLINIPLGEGSYLYFEDGQEVDMNYYYKNSYYTFKTTVLSREKESQISLYKLDLPYEVSKIQRRDYVRVDLVENVFIKPIKDEEEKEIENWSKALILNLSGGGMRISVVEKFEEEEKISIKLLLGEDDEIEVNGKVIREIERRGNSLIYGVQFVDVENIARDKIIKKVFSQMRKQIEVV